MLRGLFHHGPLWTSRAVSFRLKLGATASSNQLHPRLFSLSTPVLDKPLPPRVKINDADLITSYLKGTGPGGQKIVCICLVSLNVGGNWLTKLILQNKTNSAVQLIHKPTGLVVKSQATRSRSQNEKIAKQLLADRVEELEKGGESRTAIKADRARKKKASKMKKSHRKYRSLEEGKSSEGDEEEDEEENNDGGDTGPESIIQPSPEQGR